MIKDSGNRTEFDSGAVRDIQSGKGRCDLMPLLQIAEYLNYSNHKSKLVSNDIYEGDWQSVILTKIATFIHTQDKYDIYSAIYWFVSGMFNGSDSDMLLELAVHYEEGAKKYKERNWEKGILCHSYIDSGIRHLLKCFRGDSDERHDRAFVWNMFGLLWTLENLPEMNDLCE